MQDRPFQECCVKVAGKSQSSDINSYKFIIIGMLDFLTDGHF